MKHLEICVIIPIQWFEEILTGCGMLNVWIGIIAFVSIFSILLVPLRGGFDLTRGALGSFIMNRVNRRKPSDSDD